jgi:hypothetical protein
VRLVHHLADRQGGCPVTHASRAERLRSPFAPDVLRDLTEAAGGCTRPVQMRRTDQETGEVTYQMIPCRATLDAVCKPCAERARSLRMEQCRDGWHLTGEPGPAPAPPDEPQEFWLTTRARAQSLRDKAAVNGDDTAELDAVIAELDDELAASGIRGNLANRTTDTGTESPAGRRRVRSTRRRQDTPDLPRRKITSTTTGRVFTSPDGRTYQPSMFLTLTCDTYGKVRDGTPVDPAAYDYQRAARDAIHFPALFDRFIQNLRRYLGYDVQYFAAIEPQRRLAPHAHIAFRGAISRTDLRAVIAATYHQVWWPSTSEVKYAEGDDMPVWHEPSGGYIDRRTGEVLPTWDQALDAISATNEPLHVARFGPRFDAQGVLAGTKDAARCVRYLTKYLTKQIAGCHETGTDAQGQHARRLADALTYEPCSPRCANWLRYGIQPKHARPELRPGICRGKAHRYENLGYAGRRVLVSRKWSGKTLTDHRADRKAWLLAMLELPATDDTEDGKRYLWERVTPADPDHMPATQRLMHVLADRTEWQAALAQAQRKANDLTPALSTTDGRAA